MENKNTDVIGGCVVGAIGDLIEGYECQILNEMIKPKNIEFISNACADLMSSLTDIYSDDFMDKYKSNLSKSREYKKLKERNDAICCEVLNEAIGNETDLKFKEYLKKYEIEILYTLNTKKSVNPEITLFSLVKKEINKEKLYHAGELNMRKSLTEIIRKDSETKIKKYLEKQRIDYINENT